MANTVNLSINVTIDTSLSERKAYDNRPVKPNEVLAPMVVTEEMIDLYEMDKSNIRTWHMAGVPYLVAFYPVPATDEKLALSQFNSQVNELLGEKRDARCLIPQEDGTVKLCPKKNGNNRCSCAECPFNGIYEREDKSNASLDTLYSDYKFEVADETNIEETIILADSLNTLLQRLEEKEPRYAKIIRLLAEDFTPAEIIERIHLNKSRGYQEIHNAQKLAKKLYYK